MPKTTKTKPAQDTISIQDAVNRLQTNEQALRLALIDIRPDDFDTLKTLSNSDLEAVAKKLNPPQLPAQPENPESSETLTQQTLETTTEQPQSAPIVPQPPQQQLANSTQPPMPNAGLSMVEMVAKQATEEIAAVDGILQVRNALVLNNLAVRDAELAEDINQRWQDQKQDYLGVIRDLAGLAKTRVDITADGTNLTEEIDSIISELGKNLAV
jgi:hypothetical protein